MITLLLLALVFTLLVLLPVWEANQHNKKKDEEDRE